MKNIRIKYKLKSNCIFSRQELVVSGPFSLNGGEVENIDQFYVFMKPPDENIVT